MGTGMDLPLPNRTHGLVGLRQVSGRIGGWSSHLGPGAAA